MENQGYSQSASLLAHEKVIGRAMIACENSGHSISDDFPEVRKIVEAGATSKPKKDYELSRYACYLWSEGEE